MKPTDALSESRRITVEYRARFDNYNEVVSKMASQLGTGMRFQAELKAALDSGVPMDFADYRRRLEEEVARW